MSISSRLGWTPACSVLTAHISCLCLGLALVVWGLAPTVVQRLATHCPLPLSALALQSMVFALGGSFIAAHVLIRRGVLWGVWLGYLLSVLLCGAGIALALTHARGTSAFSVLLLSGCTACFTWLALVAWPQVSAAHPAVSAEPCADQDPGHHVD